MGLDIALHAIDIGIERMKIVNGMTKLLAFADTKDDFIYILERMQNELSEGSAEIDRMLSQNRDDIL